MQKSEDLYFLTKNDVDEIRTAQFYSMTIVGKFAGFIVMSVLAYASENNGYWLGAGAFLLLSIFCFLDGLWKNVRFRSIFKANVDRLCDEKVQIFFNELPIHDFSLTKNMIIKIFQYRGYFIKDDFNKIKRNLENEIEYLENTPEGVVIQKLIISVEQVLSK